MPLTAALIIIADAALYVVIALTFLPSLLITLYYWTLVFVKVLSQRDRGIYQSRHAVKFAIIVPAHNEEAIIQTTLNSLEKLDYPQDRFTIFVVADNCTDKTAEIAFVNGAVVLERNDLEKPGKGYALEWAFSRINYYPYDAAVVIDADCTIDGNALKIFDYFIENGARVLQANDRAANPDDSVQSLVVAVGNAIENDLFWSVKNRLGLAVFLRGTGMVLHKSIINRFPWHAHTIAEDTEYSLRLIENGVRVHFIDDAAVFSDFPASFDQLETQRKRWSGGNAELTKALILKFITAAVRMRSFLLLDAALTLFCGSRPLTLSLTVVSIFLCLVQNFRDHNPLSHVLLILSLSILLLQAAYFLTGFAILGITRKRLIRMAAAPVVIFHLSSIAIRSFIYRTTAQWVKTQRGERPKGLSVHGKEKNSASHRKQFLRRS